ncbi:MULTISPECIES: hypothetical protein [Streptomyces]|nr:hypothetical protein [Streptomyces virginiae]MCX4717199.1 hypothetical protein [Streptomyces virginiae]
MLRTALEDLAVILDQRFLNTQDRPQQVFVAFADDHGRHSDA